MRFTVASFLCLLVVVNAQVSLQGNYENVFSTTLEIQRKSRDNLLKRSEDVNRQLQSRSRLPNSVLPTLYNVTISPIIDDGQPLGERWTIPGEVIITVECQQASQLIVLHSKDINIALGLTKVIIAGGAELTIQGQEYDIEKSFFNITLDASLQVGQTYEIHLQFTSLISEALNGMYRSSYIDPDTGDRVWLATTQLEALHARQMIPCFDEPWIKAVFDVTIGRRDNHLALFNTASVNNASMEGVPGWIWEKFEPTVKMPAYLLAVIISTFAFKESTANALTGKTVRVYAPQHYIAAEGGTYAADLSDKILAYFQEYYNQIYPLSKMDSVAVPDFYYGAMENWGLNIYRETNLLYFQGESTEIERYQTTRILGHELGHQWFGNLVTCNFWTHIWLNEGFATYSAAQAVNETHPEYEPWERFQNDVVQVAMEFDARPEVTHSLKIDEDLWYTKDAMDWFDRLAYEKGGSLIRMMKTFLTEETFKKGIRRYLEDKKYQGAVQDELFANLHIDALEDNRLPSGLSMKDIMDTWTLQPYFPLIRISRSGNNRVVISQEIFSNDPRPRAVSSLQQDTNDLWHVPLSIATAASPNFDPRPELWIEKDVTVKTHNVDTSQWIIANAGATGYYRVLYDNELTEFINQQLNSNHLVISSSVTRSQLLDDYFAAAFQRYSNIESALSLTKYLSKETEIVVWNTVLRHLRKALNLIRDESLKTYLLPKVSSALQLVGGANATVSPGMETLRHQQFLDWSCALESPECEAFAKNIFNQWKSTPATNPVRLDIRPVVYCAIVATGGQEAFDFIKARYNENTISAKQKNLLLNSLGCAKEAAVIDGILQNILIDGYDIPKNVRGTLLARLSVNSAARPKVISFFVAKAQDIGNYFEGIDVMTAAVSQMSSYMSTWDEYYSIEEFQNGTAELIGTSLSSSLQVIAENIRWMNEFGTKMSAYFTSNSEETTTTIQITPTTTQGTPTTTGKATSIDIYKLVYLFSFMLIYTVQY